MSRRQAEALTGDLDHDDILAVQEVYAMAWDRVELVGEVDADVLLESLETRLELAPFAERAGLSVDHRDARPYRRVRRRNEARALRELLPHRLPVAGDGGMGEVA